MRRARDRARADRFIDAQGLRRLLKAAGLGQGLGRKRYRSTSDNEILRTDCGPQGKPFAAHPLLARGVSDGARTRDHRDHNPSPGLLMRADAAQERALNAPECSSVALNLDPA